MKRFLLCCSTAVCVTAIVACAAPNEEKVALPQAHSVSRAIKAAEVVAHPNPMSAVADDDITLAYNKRLVFDMWRSIVNAGHVELADDMLKEDYIQHSPILPTGRAAFKTIFSVVPRRDIPELVSPPLVTILAEGNLVVMALREELPEPHSAGLYTTTHFNLFRIEDERLAEHWHSIQDSPGPNVLPPERGGPQLVTGATGRSRSALAKAKDSKLAANKKLVFDQWAKGGFRFLRTANYIDHDPNAGVVEAAADETSSNDVPIVAIVAQDDLVVLITAREHPHPSRKGAIYTTTWFDMFRIEADRIVEHWNSAIKPGTAAASYN